MMGRNLSLPKKAAGSMGKINGRAIYIILVAGIVFLATSCVWAAMPEFHGFTEFAYGPKVSGDNTKRDNFNLLEQRLQLKTKYLFESNGFLAQRNSFINFKGDFTVD